MLPAAVVKLLESAHPRVEYTCKKYMEAHDVIVASAYYTRTFDIAAGFMNRVRTPTFTPQWIEVVIARLIAE